CQKSVTYTAFKARERLRRAVWGPFTCFGCRAPCRFASSRDGGCGLPASEAGNVAKGCDCPFPLRLVHKLNASEEHGDTHVNQNCRQGRVDAPGLQAVLLRVVNARH